MGSRSWPHSLSELATGMLPVEQIAGSEIPVADVAQQYLGEIGALAMVIGAVLATVSSANASILSADELKGEGPSYRVLVPVANPATERRLIERAAAVASEYEDAELVLMNVIEVPPQTALQQDIQFQERRVQAQQLAVGGSLFALDVAGCKERKFEDRRPRQVRLYRIENGGFSDDPNP